MSAARIPHIPLSGRDRRHYAAELRKAETSYRSLLREAEAAHAGADRALSEAHRLDCELWSTRLFLGGRDEPSPTIADALHGGHPMLEVQCRHCNHTEMVDLAEVVWPRSRPIHTLSRVLYCAKCRKRSDRKRRPDLIKLRPRPSDDPSPPAAAMRRSK